MQVSLLLVSEHFGNIDIGGDVDVDGHTNLDNVSIAGVTTASDNVIIPIMKLVHKLVASYIFIITWLDLVIMFESTSSSFI